MQEHLRDYVWMALPGGTAEKVPATTDEISRKMVSGYSQVFPGNDNFAAAEPAPSAQEEQQ